MGLHQEVGLAIDVVILVFQTSKCVPRPPYSRATSSTVRPRFNLLQQSNELRLRAFCGGEAYDPLNKHYAGLAPTLNLCDSFTTLTNSILRVPERNLTMSIRPAALRRRSAHASSSR